MANEGEATESIEENVDYSKWTDEQLVEAGWTAQQVVDLRLGNSEAEEPAEEAEEPAEEAEEPAEEAEE
ncbi:MAG: hypothetical protein CMA27_02295, partial [Euryarchaeota archaeon]|nr:hypothetical protein [Euryarchaeota archaeon]